MQSLPEACMGLIETGGRASQDLGLGRIVGQVLVYLYLQPQACPLDRLESDLGLSKASVSIAARQLEQLGLVQQVWKPGERKKYYRSAENIGQALQQGLLSLIRQKVADFGGQLDVTIEMLEDISDIDDQQINSLRQRIKRASDLQKRLDRVLGNPLVNLLTRTRDANRD
jgi:DNA-binding transcriptional regulator GbsR (MarR family)